MSIVTKESLAQKWEFTGVDTTELLNNIYTLCLHYGHEVTKYGIAAFLSEFITQKTPLIKKLMKSEFYCGNLQAKIPCSITFPFNPDNMAHTFYELRMEMQQRAENTDKHKNSKGLTHVQARNEVLSKRKSHVMNTRSFANIKKLNNDASAMGFDTYGQYIPTIKKLRRGEAMLEYLKSQRNLRPNLSTETADKLNSIEDLKFNDGMVTARAVNRICATYYNCNDSDKRYQKLFADYSNSAREITIDCYYVISLNPIDYLTSAFGNSWSSCHTIDRGNKRNIDSEHIYSGAHMGGTLSYALDTATFVTYTISQRNKTTELVYDDFKDWSVDLTKHPEFVYKINRQLVHMSTDGQAMIMSRVYPQTNDGSMGKSLREQFYNLFFKTMGSALPDVSTWEFIDNTYNLYYDNDEDNPTNYFSTADEATHYPDYRYENFGAAYYGVNGIAHQICIGHVPINLYTGLHKPLESAISKRVEHRRLSDEHRVALESWT